MLNAHQQLQRHSVWLVPQRIVDVTKTHKKDFKMSTAKELDNNEKKSENHARWIWVGVICALMGLQVAINVVAVVLASGQSDDEIVTDYYQKGINWDQRDKKNKD